MFVSYTLGLGREIGEVFTFISKGDISFKLFSLLFELLLESNYGSICYLRYGEHGEASKSDFKGEAS